MKVLCVLAVLVVSISALAQLGPADVQLMKSEPPVFGIVWARGVKPPQAKSPFGGSGSADMSYHNGSVLTNAVVQPIFWGTSWPTYTGDEITGMDSWYKGFGGSTYAETSNEYYETVSGTNYYVSASASYSGPPIVDGSTASGGQRSSKILAEVCKEVGSNVVSNGYYPVYVDLSRSGSYCAWHSYGSCSVSTASGTISVPVQFAFFWKLDGDAGCDPQSTVAGESQGLAALANVSAHELSEARTDPNGCSSGSWCGWYDSSGQENGDKCSWEFGSPYVTFSNGTQWKLQGEWSNYAYDHSLGFANSSGQKGCVDGGNYPSCYQQGKCQ